MEFKLINVEGEIERLKRTLNVMKFAKEEATKIPEKNLARALERHIMGLNQQIEGVHTTIMTAEELKIEADEELTEVRGWSHRTKAELSECESFLEELEAITTELQRERMNNKRFEWKKTKTKEVRKREFNEALKLEQARIEVRKKFKRDIGELHEKSKWEQQARVKLPKLVPSQFQ